MKQHIDDLAIFGGTPTFSSDLHVGRPNIGDREQLLARINDLLDRKWLSNNGPYVQEFEKRIAETSGVKHCIAMCNGAVALEIAIRSLGLSGEVIVPSFTFIATAHALQWQEITPVFCDVDRRTHNIDPELIERMITPRTTGIIGVHLWGRACDVDALTDIAQRHNLKLLFDAAHAFGCSYQGRMIGGFGNAEVYSFHATKFLNTFEGGAVVTNDDELAARIRLMKNFGFAGYDDVSYIGTNGKMNEVSAAMGLTSLESMDDFIDVNHRHYRHYLQELSNIPGITIQTYNEQERCNYQYIILEIDSERAKVSRDQLHKILWAERVLARRYFYPACHRMEPYRSYFPHAGLLLPHTVTLASQVLALPTGTGMRPEDIGEICRIIRLVVANGVEVSGRL
ncbi:MAG: aminotransferase class I/II-fold pyridoxal phosphate-dependent enzyme [Saprospiraceae bacterium]|nr:aminotransferase class I/II-fold pyridoxal phosphate-dependent enzyme [Lewinella sp.]